jgi:hypothetical protein
MLGYVTLGSNNLARGAAFYDALCGALGVPRMMENETFIAWGEPNGGPGIGLTKPFDGKPASVGNGVMVALAARDRAHVDALTILRSPTGEVVRASPGRAPVRLAFTPAIFGIRTATSSTRTLWGIRRARRLSAT